MAYLVRSWAESASVNQPPLGDGSDQLHALIQEGVALTTELSLERLLLKIAEVTRDVLHARYTALAVLKEGGTGLSHFVTAGIDDATKVAIGALPTGTGFLGQLIAERQPIRLRRLASHPWASGFPANHPPMESFLGVPIVLRDKAYGFLYAADKQGEGEFSEADETVALMLAAQAAFVIENAHAFEALRSALEELARNERLATLGQLAGSVGHELRNPLGVIKNSVHYLRMLMPEDERVRKHLTILEREVTTSNRIVSDLLDFARVKAPVREEARLDELVRVTLEQFTIPPTIRVDARLDIDCPPVSVDPHQVRQILTNLIQNALQAMPEGGTLGLTADRDKDGPYVAVNDTGPGIPAGDLARIFRPLFTTKVKGIGLGLSIARDFADANGARLTVESPAGSGSRFLLRFPQRTAG